MTTNEMFDDLYAKRERLAKMKKHSPEVAAAVKLAEETAALQEEILSQGRTMTFVPSVYPVWPVLPYTIYPSPYRVTYVNNLCAPYSSQVTLTLCDPTTSQVQESEEEHA